MCNYNRVSIIVERERERDVFFKEMKICYRIIFFSLLSNKIFTIKSLEGRLVKITCHYTFFLNAYNFFYDKKGYILLKQKKNH